MLVAILLQNALFVAFLAPLVWLLTRIFRNPVFAHVLWVTLLVKLITPSLFVIPVNMDVAIGIRELCQSSTLKVLLATIWILGSIVTMLSFLSKAEAFRRAILRHGVFHAPASDLAKEVDKGGRFFQTPEVVLVDAVHSPMLCGIGPFAWVLFPKDLWYALSLEQRRGLMAHELAHFRRGDYLIRVLELFVTLLLWWYPLRWLIKREIERAEEDCCDAVACRYGAKNYAQAMLTTLDFLSEPEQFRPLISTQLLGKANPIERRLHRILKCSKNPTLTSSQRLLVAGLAAAILFISPQIGLL